MNGFSLALVPSAVSEISPPKELYPPLEFFTSGTLPISAGSMDSTSSLSSSPFATDVYLIGAPGKRNWSTAGLLVAGTFGDLFLSLSLLCEVGLASMT